MAEYLGLYNSKKEKLSKKMLRVKGQGIDVLNGDYYMIVMIIMENSNNEFLLQMTSKKKNSIWALTGGHVQDNQTPLEAIIDEFSEELGIDLCGENIELFKSYKFDNKFLEVYYINKDINIENMIYQESEVEYAKYLTKDEILNLIENDLIRGSSVKPLLDFFSKKRC